jgi:hypothetical protein
MTCPETGAFQTEELAAEPPIHGDPNFGVKRGHLIAHKKKAAKHDGFSRRL